MNLPLENISIPLYQARGYVTRFNDLQPAFRGMIKSSTLSHGGSSWFDRRGTSAAYTEDREHIYSFEGDP